MLDFLMDTANIDCHDVVNFNDKDGADVEWVKQARDSGGTSFVGFGHQSEDLKQQRSNAKRIRDSEEQVEILKKAIRIFTEKPR
jgi:hypothetical protein